ncbi:TRAP dicarboxylate transporter permease protein DctM subunit [Rhizobium etli bv. phaseoli str. IE4803]|uniref:TRAP transporter large permease protein n=1 Tax=Rhizobium etli bv. mimosae str. IE4771 TaxID=1432050 RepID=A0A060I796_RHIET|nr:TRAP transporter large permease [Rhizobium sp. IE4771]AIC27431.1 TRAP dicarboxylate transporter permease protein DctM subunit [Rhizobium sp. IE4771]AJC79434.1 TRAP dicarboxylate transporter permease protein DctM subunit [Rhizobium etli bv. phaseoli str. IE4803]
MTVIILMGVFLLLMLIDVPIAIALMGGAMVAMIATGEGLMPAAQSMLTTVDSFSLLAIPLFIAAGDLMNRGGITSRLVDLSSAMVGHIRGSLAQTGVIAAMFFGGVSGSAVADTAAVGSAIIPPMVKQGYDRAFSAALIATSGTLGMLMPTSITLIIFALTANVSIARLLLAGLIPGVVTAVMLCIYAYVYSVRKGYTAGVPFSFRRLLRAFGGAIIPGVTPGIIVTGIVGGVFTPTEAGAVAVVYAALIGLFYYRELNLKSLLDCAVHTSLITGLVLFLIFTSFAFSWVITLERVPELFSNYLLGGTTSPVVVFILMNLFLLAIGTFLDPTPTILITVPIFLPIAVQFGIDPIHFGIIFALNMAIAQVSPPAGSVLFTACGIARVSMVQVTPPLMPFMAVQLISLILFILAPSLVLFLPNLIMGN